MGIFNRFSGEFVDIIEWTQTDSDTMVYRFPRYKNEIKYGAKLTVREGQTAILVNEGKVADVFPPGIYELQTANLPILSTLQNWHHGFESPFKAEVYFFNTTDFLDLKWGTKQPVTLSDAQFGIVRLRAFGSYTMRISNAEVFLRKLVGTDGNFEITEVSNQLTNAIVTRFPEVLAESDSGLLELPAKYSELATTVEQLVEPEFAQYGLDIGKVYIESISLPDDVQKVLDEKTGMNIIGDSMNDYTKFQAAQGMKNADNSGSSMASAGIGMAMGMEMGKDMVREMQSQPAQPAATQPQSPQQSQTAETTVAPEQPKQAPPPSPPIYYLMVLGERLGPMTLEDVYRKLEQGEVSKQTLIWRQGMVEWQSIVSSAEVDLSHIPPPPPPRSS